MICGIIPAINPQMISDKEWALIDNLDEATNPIEAKKKATISIPRFWQSKERKNRNTVKAPIPIMCKLIFFLNNKPIKANNVLTKAPK